MAGLNSTFNDGANLTLEDQESPSISSIEAPDNTNSLSGKDLFEEHQNIVKDKLHESKESKEESDSNDDLIDMTDEFDNKLKQLKEEEVKSHQRYLSNLRKRKERESSSDSDKFPQKSTRKTTEKARKSFRNERRPKLNFDLLNATSESINQSHTKGFRATVNKIQECGIDDLVNELNEKKDNIIENNEWHSLCLEHLEAVQASGLNLLESAKQIQAMLGPIADFEPEVMFATDMERDPFATLYLGPVASKVPINTTADGSCMFHSVSIALYGNEKKSTELRLRTALELIIKKDFYKRKYPLTSSIGQISDLNTAVKNAIQLKGWSGMFTISALSNAIGININVMCSPHFGANSVSSMTIYEKMNHAFEPDIPSSKTVHLLWSTYNNINTVGPYKFNHFVPLLDTNEPHYNFHEYMTSITLLKNKAKAETKNKRQKNVTIEIPASDEGNSEDDIEVEDYINSETKNDDQHDSREYHAYTKQESESVGLKEKEEEEAAEKSISSGTDVSIPIERHQASHELKYNHFMSPNDVWHAISEEPDIDEIPSNVLGKEYFVIKSEENWNKLNSGSKDRLRMHDSCGQYDNSSTQKYFYEVSNEGNISFFAKTRSQANNKLKNKKSKTDLVIMYQLTSDHHSYKKTKFRRRVTMFHNLPDQHSGKASKAVVQYENELPNKGKVHGNVKVHGSSYVRSKPKDLDELKKMDNHGKPRETYRNLLLQKKPIRNIRQAKYVKEITSETIASKNFANQVQDIINMTNAPPYNTFIKGLNMRSNEPPSTILYNNHQMQEMLHFCALPEKPSIVCLDRTYNLSSLFVTSAVYEHPLLRVRGPKDIKPTLFGPIYIHKGADKNAYMLFLNHIKEQLPIWSIQQQVDCNLVLGGDDEKALREAEKEVFQIGGESNSGVKLVTCTRHLQQNLLRQMKAKDIPIAVQKEIEQEIFGTHKNDSSCLLQNIGVDEFQERKEKLLKKYEDLKQFKPYLDALCDKIQNYVIQPTEQGLIPADWKNNRAESMNAVLRDATNYSKQTFPDIIKICYDIVHGQQQGIINSFLGQGNWEVIPRLKKKYEIGPRKWDAMNEHQQEKHYLNFIKEASKKDKKKKLVTSTDGRLTMPDYSKTAKKPNQRKGPQAERTRTIRKTKRQEDDDS